MSMILSLIYQRLDRQVKRYGFKIVSAAPDTGYQTNPACKVIHGRNTFGVYCP